MAHLEVQLKMVPGGELRQRPHAPRISSQPSTSFIALDRAMLARPARREHSGQREDWMQDCFPTAGAAAPRQDVADATVERARQADSDLPPEIPMKAVVRASVFSCSISASAARWLSVR